MNFYWGVNSIPELQGLPKAEQRLLWQVGRRAALRIPHIRAAYAVQFVMFMIGATTPALLDAFPSSMPLTMLWGGLWGVGGSLIFNQFLIKAMRPILTMRRAALEAKPRAEDGSYYVPPAF